MHYGNPDDLFGPAVSGACERCGAETYDGAGHECPGEVDRMTAEQFTRLVSLVQAAENLSEGIGYVTIHAKERRVHLPEASAHTLARHGLVVRWSRRGSDTQWPVMATVVQDGIEFYSLYELADAQAAGAPADLIERAEAEMEKAPAVTGTSVNA